MTTYLLIHGAYHGGWCWKRVVSLLRAAGHEVYTPTLTGLAARAHLLTPDVGLNTHIQDVLGVLEYEDLHEVILVGHSYGGMVISGAAEEMPGRIARLVYLDAFVPAAGQSVADFYPQGAAARFKDVADKEGDGYILPAPAAERFGISSAEDLAWVRPRLSGHPLKAVLDPIQLANPQAAALPRTYIYCSDPGTALFSQFAERLRKDKAWGYLELAAAHDAMITEPEQLVHLLLNFVRGDNTG